MRTLKLLGYLLISVVVVVAVALGSITAIAYRATRPVLRPIASGDVATPPSLLTPGSVLVAGQADWGSKWQQLGNAGAVPPIDFDHSKLAVVWMQSRISGGRSLDVQRYRYEGGNATVTARLIGECGGMNPDAWHWIVVKLPKATKQLNVNAGDDMCRDPRSMQRWFSVHTGGADF